MRKYLFLCHLLLLSVVVFAQRRPQPTIVHLLRSDRSEGIKRNGEDVIKVYRGVFQQESSTLRSDSAYFYPQRNSFDAFGNVNINQGDTLNVYGDKLYYNGNTHVALLTNNVRLVDRDATLTTNYLTYNTATRIGTYTGGGKLVNKDNVLVSKNGYYFANSRDAYFRYNVVLTTIDATILTDSLRYNSGTRISYFFGPTRIIGKDKDTLYTEKGNYNTVVEQAFFSKNNLYTQTTKSLKGDSLFYDRLKGYGRALGNVTFNDNEQKVTIKGQLGTYTKATDETVITQNPYVIMITEQRDTTQKAKEKVPTPVKSNRVKTADNKKASPAGTKVVSNAKAVVLRTDTANLKTDTLALKPPAKIKRDTIYWGADIIKTQIVIYKELRELQERMRLSGIKDTTVHIAKAAPVVKTPLKLSTTSNLIAMPPAEVKMDMSFLRPDIFGKPKVADTTQKQKPVAVVPKKKAAVAAVPKVAPLDSVYLKRKFNLSDTARIRILSAYHNAKIFKSDLQAKADSMFYSYADSTMRCFVNPIIWAQGSQISGDTVYLQLKNKKVDNMEVFLSAFTVNIEENDSTHFNQVAGKRMRGFFVENKFERLFVDGNAETIYYNRDSTKTVTDLLHTASSRIRVNFKQNKVSDVTWFTKPENNILPIGTAKDDDKILKGFLWKPKERPANKEAIIYPRGRSKAPSKKVPVKVQPAKGKKIITPSLKKTLVDSAVTRGLLPTVDSASVKAIRDSVNKVLPNRKAVLDSVRNKLLKP